MGGRQDCVGFDIGALYVKAVRSDGNGTMTHRFYRLHRGDPGAALEAALAALDIADGEAIGITGSAADLFAETLGVELLDITRCQIEAVHRLLPEARHIIDIGGASATLVRLDAEGRFLGYASNSLCAAGTGSFLDEQAGRLGISTEEMAGFAPIDQPPTIASRCSVFAKSDLIHRQQEGYSKAEMWSGLCQGMTRNLLGTLLNGRPLDGPAAIIGGVAQNQEVLRWLRTAYPEFIHTPAEPHLTAALGAALLARPPAAPIGRVLPARVDLGAAQGSHEWPLSLERSIYPDFDTEHNYTDDDGNEVRINQWPAGAVLRGVLGIDIGSTSTKLALVDEDDRVVVDIYRKTGGDPVGATKLLFRALRALATERNTRLDIAGVGTTGSGRKLVGTIIGADAIINEISAHVAGAVATDPTIDTIFEIGGQDSKYMHVVDGHIRDANMNYVCAAGTGSFVEEQANKLGYPVADIGPAVLGLHPPLTSDRCTVFMEQDMAALVQSGTRPEQALAGVMVSVVKNYLNKVVGNRYRSREKIFFQGATARNPALVAAFERLLGVQMVVSPYCHVMGAFGVALLTRQAMAERGTAPSAFRGLDLDGRDIRIRYETCTLCQNNCKITFAEVEGLDEQPSYGYMCGRDPSENQVRQNPHERALKLRQKLWKQAGRGLAVAADAPVVGLPQALTTYSYLPLWRRFLNRLGFRVKLSGITDDEVRQMASRITGAEFCFPAKLVMGHAAKLVLNEGVDHVLLPHVVSEQQNAYTSAAKFCPYVQAAPSYTRTALEVNGMPVANILSPVIDMRLGERQIVDLLVEELAAPLGVTRRQLRAAWRDGLAAQRGFERRCAEEGRKLLAEAKAAGEKMLVLLGRPYNNYDSGQNLGLPGKLAEQGRTVLPLDFLDADRSLLGPRYQNIFWNYGQKILAACERVARDPDLDAVYLTNFSCGPDSFLLSFAEEIMGHQPFLALELDEHGADAGYMTRIEAFFDVLRRPSESEPRKVIGNGRLPWRPEPARVDDRLVWIPPMHPYGTGFFAACFRNRGIRARPLPIEDKAVFERGRSVTRGAECLPTALTIGALLEAVERSGEPPSRQALFMPTAEGPCRFGLYTTLHRQVLDRADMRGLAILSPSSHNSYQGVDEKLRRMLWQAMLASDQLLKTVCKVRPYEVQPGATDEVLAAWCRKIEAVIESGGDLFAALRQAVEALAAVPRHHRPKPLVGVVGEIYVRCNPFANENVIDAIERYGGEAWLAPMTEWILYTVATQTIAFKDGNRNPLVKWLSGLKNFYIIHQERRMVEAAGPFLSDRLEPPVEDVIAAGQRYIPIHFEGEAILTMGRTIEFAEQGAAMVVNCAPFGCMPGTLTTALFRKLAPELGIPVVGMFYDGGGNLNKKLEIFLHNAVGQHAPPRSAADRPAELTAGSSDRRQPADLPRA